MRIFHTSDWHLGKMLGDWDRTEDFVFFLDWLLAKITERRPDILLIAGDVFDVSMPPIAAQRLYYGFLERAASTPLQAVVVTAGNHDSQSFLSASAEVLRSVRTIVAGPTPEEQSIVVRDREGRPLAAIAAVPFLKEGEVRKGLALGDALDELALYEAGIEARYALAHEKLLEAMAREGAENVPKIAMGHLYLRDSIPKERREKVLSDPQVGSIRMADLSRLGSDWDYVALGHLHRAGKLEGAVPARYSGIPISLDVKHQDYLHQIVEVNFTESGVEEILHDVPQKRAVRILRDHSSELPAALEKVASELPECYVGMELTDPKPTRDLLEPLVDKCAALGLRFVSFRLASPTVDVFRSEEGLTLEMLTPEAVFDEVLREAARGEEESERLRAFFAEVARDAMSGGND